MAKKFTALCMAATLTWTSMDVSAFASDSQGVTEVTQGRAQTITGTEGEIVGEFFVTGGMNGEEKAYTYDGNVLTIIKDTSISISNAENVETITDSIVVASGVTADIILNNIVMKPDAASPISISDGAKANITLVGENVLTGGIGDSNTYAGIYVPQGAGLVIGGTGSLTATGGGMVKINGSYPHNYRAAGIGGNGEQRDIHAGSIVINGGTIIATGGTAVNNKADGIGGGHYTLNGVDSKDYRGSCELTINGGLVKADSVTSDHLSKMVITIYEAKDGTIIDGGSGFPEGYCFDGVKTIGDKLYFYLPTGIVPEALICEGVTYTGSVSEGTGIFFNMKEVKENPEIDLSTGSVTFSKVGDVLTYTMGNETVLYSGAATIVDGDGTGNVIEVEKGVHDIVLNNVSIKPESASPISILSDAEAKITLVGDNVLIGGNKGFAYAGIYVSLDGRLIIDGTGSLTAIGGSYRQSDDDSESYGSAAGIGGNGGSWNVHAGHILIMGGSVTATGESNERCKASAIGGGHYIYSYYGSDDTSDNTSEYKGEAVVTIECGSVQADSIGAAPKNLNEEELYLLTIANPEKLEVTIDGNEYNPSVHSTDDTNLYAYVTGREHTVSVGGKETKYDFVDGKFYILLSEEMFTYVEPDSLIYDGAGKTASVMVNRDVEVGEITVKLSPSFPVTVFVGAAVPLLSSY